MTCYWPAVTPASTHRKYGGNKPHLKFNFTYKEGFSGQFVDCRNGLWTCLIFDSMQLPSKKLQYIPLLLFTSCYIIYIIYIIPVFFVSQKKMGLVFRGHFRPLDGRKSKKGRKQTPPKIQLYRRGQFGDCRNGLWTCLIFDSMQLPSKHLQYIPLTSMIYRCIQGVYVKKTRRAENPSY